MRCCAMVRMVLVVAAALLCGCASGTYQLKSGERVPALQVVRTWDELMAQPVVGMGDEAVRVGIEAKKCEAGMGVLVYCVPVGSRISGRLWQGERMGPVCVRVISLEGNNLREAAEAANEDRAMPKVPFFYAAGARADYAGKYEVQVIGQGGKVLAATRIEAKEANGLPWMTFKSLSASKIPGESRYAWSNIEAAPHWEGMSAMAKVQRLPRFIPVTEDPRLDVSVKKGLVTVKSEHCVERFMTDDWLIRWWVNGKPVMGEAGARHGPRIMRDMAEQIVEPMEFSFWLDPFLTDLKAKDGDVVEFQLLYSSGGVDFRGEGELSLEQAMKRPLDAMPVRLSQRVRWEGVAKLP